jgi:hypothetical protein
MHAPEELHVRLQHEQKQLHRFVAAAAAAAGAVAVCAVGCAVECAVLVSAQRVLGEAGALRGRAPSLASCLLETLPFLVGCCSCVESTGYQK